VGFARRARSELATPIWAHERELPVAAHPWRYDHERSRLPYFRHPRYVAIFTLMGIHGALFVKGVEGVQTYAGGQQLDVPGRPLVVYTPGHSHGHSSLHFPERSAVIAGDALVTLDPYTGREGPCIVAGAATADSRQALASLDALAETGAETVLPGHGEPWTGGVAAAVERARAAGPA
jgi:glyoxylase-like metal-dependent hydrolase (beta-lactamase superfamily II)